MDLLDLDWRSVLNDLIYIAAAFALAFPIGWERGRGPASVGFRTLPIVAMAACGFALTVRLMPGTNPESQARVLQGIITGIGFVGGGAIVKQGTDVRGLVTAASIWNVGAIGVAIGYGRANIAVVLCVANLATLWLLTPLVERHSHSPGSKEEA